MTACLEPDPPAWHRLSSSSPAEVRLGPETEVAAERDYAMLWRPPVPGVEVLHARFVRYKYPRHTHEAVTVALMDAGSATFRYRNKDFVATAGDVFLLNADAVHTGRPVNDRGYSYRVLYLHPAEFEPLLAAGSDRLPRLAFRQTVLSDPAMAELLHQAHQALASTGSMLLSEELVVRIGRSLITRYGEPVHSTLGTSRSAQRAVATARDYLRAHPSERVSLRELATVASMSPYSLTRMFTAAVGIPPHAYHVQLRVQLARRLLAEGVPTASVATQTGFYDQAHLSRVFKQYTGVTPGHFARETRRTAYYRQEGAGGA